MPVMLEVGYGQLEYQAVIARNIEELVGQRFLVGEPDEQVCRVLSI